MATNRLLGMALPALALALMAPADDAGAQDAKRGGIKAAACAQCHGLDGAGRFPTVPHLAGLGAPYIAQQLRAFRGTAQGRRETRGGYSRHEMVMDHQAATLKDGDIQDLAAYYSGLACPLPDPKKAVKDVEPPNLASRCTACHGPEGRGASPTVPRIAGQQLRYLQNQLRSFFEAVRDGAGDKARRWRSHPIMEGQVGRATLPALMQAAEYFASRRCR